MTWAVSPRASAPPPAVDARFRWPLYEDVVAEVTFSGGAVTPDDVDLLQEYLNTVKKARSRAPRIAPPTPEPARATIGESGEGGDE